MPGYGLGPMRGAWCLLAMVSTLVLAGCQSAQDNFLEGDEDRLTTGGQIAKYHYLVRDPYSIGLSHEGFIVGIEKSPHGDIGKPQQLDSTRFRLWELQDDPQGSQYLDARNEHLGRHATDPKATFVSHIMAYGADPQSTARFDVCPLYSAYAGSGFAPNARHPLCTAIAQAETCDSTTTAARSSSDRPRDYENGWKALDRLYYPIKAKLDQAEPAYTHIIVASMGWNNDQVESVRRYNALLGNIVAHSRLENDRGSEPFNPLVIGLTWPSVWGGDSFFSTINLGGHLISYPNKAEDADEIGYTIANYLVNKIVYRVKQEEKKRDLKVVLIGHSMGARILSRAMFSAHLLKADTCGGRVGNATDLFIGLQGAFSVRRFKQDNEPPFPVSLFTEGEGSPYLIYGTLPGRVVLTWSDADAANPVAEWVTGAAHAGGTAGYDESLEMKEVFEQFVWADGEHGETDFTRKEANEKTRLGCPVLETPKKILMVDANTIVKNHNDILDSEMGRLIWKSIRCFSDLKE